MQTASTESAKGQGGHNPVCNKMPAKSQRELRHKGTVGEEAEIGGSRPYFRGCSFDSMCWPGAGTAVPKVRNTRRSTMPEMIKTSPTRKRPMVSGRCDRDVRIICTTMWVQMVGQTQSSHKLLIIMPLTPRSSRERGKGVKQNGKLMYSFSKGHSHMVAVKETAIRRALTPPALSPRVHPTLRSQPSRQ